MKPHHYLCAIFAVFLLLSVKFSARAQDADSVTYLKNKIYFWGGGHIGGGAYLINYGTDAGMMFKNQFVITAKADWNHNYSIFEDHKSGEALGAQEINLMLGHKFNHFKYTNMFLLAGVSVNKITDKGTFTYVDKPYPGYYNYDEDHIYRNIGVPIAFKILIAPAGYMAMDFTAAANINAGRSFVSVTFGLLFGKLRSGPDHLPRWMEN